MAEHPMFPLWTDAYLGDTGHLTTAEHGAYLLMLMTAWRSGTASLPNDPEYLRRITKMRADKWRESEAVLMAFWVVENGRLVQRRLQDEWQSTVRYRERNSKKARRRWALKNNDSNNAAAMPLQCPEHAAGMLPPSPSPKKEEISIISEFEAFWTKYPRKVGKGQARRAFATARKKATQEILMTAISRIDASDPKFTPHPATWLNGERWLDQPNGINGKHAPTSPEDTWRHRLRAYCGRGVWSEAWGPSPKTGSCDAPPAVLAEFNLRA